MIYYWHGYTQESGGGWCSVRFDEGPKRASLEYERTRIERLRDMNQTARKEAVD